MSRAGAIVPLLAACALLASAPATLAQRPPPVRVAPAPVEIEAELTPERVYVGGEARLRLRLTRAPGVTHGVLRLAPLDDAAEVSLLGPIQTYETERAGVVYEILERSHVIVPRREGRLVLPGAEFEGALRYAEVLDRRPDAATRSAPALTVRGPERVLEVLPRPAGTSEPWLPARRVTLEEAWSRDLDALAAGKPVTRTVILRAEGLAAERLPQIRMVAHPALRVHHDQPALDTAFLDTGIEGRSVQRIALMPVAAAEVQLPAIRVTWWDVVADAPRTETLPARTLTLHSTIAPVAVPRAAEPRIVTPSILKWLVALVLLVIGVIVWWLRRTQATRLARQRLFDACTRNDPRAARDALLAWRRATGMSDPGTALHRVAGAWPEAGVRAQLAALDAALYADRAWNGTAFWLGVEPRLRGSFARRAGHPARETLPGLFRLHARESARHHP